MVLYRWPDVGNVGRDRTEEEEIRETEGEEDEETRE